MNTCFGAYCVTCILPGGRYAQAVLDGCETWVPEPSSMFDPPKQVFTREQSLGKIKAKASTIRKKKKDDELKAEGDALLEELKVRGHHIRSTTLDPPH